MVTKLRLGIAGIAAALGCVACCALPIVAAGLGGTVGTTVGGVMGPGAEVVTGIVAFGASLAAMVGVEVWRKRRAMKSNCGCGTTAKRDLYVSGPAKENEPLVCTADLNDARGVDTQLEGYRAAFGHLVASERFEGGVRWRFRAVPGLEAHLAELATRERACCQFFQFDLVVDGEEIIWETRAQDHARTILDEFFTLPDRLRASADVATVKAAAERAGLVFARE
jgi:hypothetical protein